MENKYHSRALQYGIVRLISAKCNIYFDKSTYACCAKDFASTLNITLDVLGKINLVFVILSNLWNVLLQKLIGLAKEFKCYA